uniref:Uncharacterized protein n=1 Tax=Helianthus annuus TaxID=4232 RepID=A0A251RQY7_HELAN
MAAMVFSFAWSPRSQISSLFPANYNKPFPHKFLAHSQFSFSLSIGVFPAIGDLLPEFLSVSQHKNHFNT